MNNKNLLVVAGPTAVGKTNLCINLAKKFDTCIISADSRQFFREMNIGTAKPTEKELAEVKHYFIDNLSIRDDYDAAQFEKEALSLLSDLFNDHDLLILTGGSGMYLNAVLHGLDNIPEVDKAIRAGLNVLLVDKGIGHLQEKLRELDPVHYKTVDLHNPQRLVRALEVSLGTGRPYSDFRQGKRASRQFNTLKIGLTMDREELYARIERRIDAMIDTGLFEEAADLFPFKAYHALQTVGYKEIFGFFEGKYDKEEAVRLLKRNTRRYAKRQMTWFKKDEDYQWFHPSQFQEIVGYIEGQIVE